MESLKQIVVETKPLLNFPYQHRTSIPGCTSVSEKEWRMNISQNQETIYNIPTGLYIFLRGPVCIWGTAFKCPIALEGRQILHKITYNTPDPEAEWSDLNYTFLCAKNFLHR